MAVAETSKIKAIEVSAWRRRGRIRIGHARCLRLSLTNISSRGQRRSRFRTFPLFAIHHAGRGLRQSAQIAYPWIAAAHVVLGRRALHARPWVLAIPFPRRGFVTVTIAHHL